MQAAKTVRGEDSQAIATDGPFAETKEAVGGCYIVDCSQGEAVAIAGRIPTGAHSWIQVRPIALFHPNVARIAQMKD